MEAAVRLVQGGGPNGQRIDASSAAGGGVVGGSGGGGGQQQQQPPPNALTHQVRQVTNPVGVPPPGATQVRQMDIVQSGYSAKLQAPMQKIARSSPISPPRTAATTYYAAPVVRDSSGARYPQQIPYRQVGGQQFREIPYKMPTNVHQMEYHRLVSNVSSATNSLMPGGGGGGSGAPPPMHEHQSPPGGVVEGRQRISLLPHGAVGFMLPAPTRQITQSDHDIDGQPAFKKIRFGENYQPQGILKIDVPEAPPAAGAYHPQVEAISPTLPSDAAEEIRAAKDDLLQQISKVDSEIGKVEKSIGLLKKKEASLQEASAKPPATEETSETLPKHRSLAQKIYAENKRKASLAHAMLASLGPPIDLPLYNQPSDVEACRAIIERNVTFKPRLLLHCQKIKSEKCARSNAFAETYVQKSQEWLRRVEKNEASAKRKAKEAKNREFFEKVFPELRKQREDKERFNRVGSRIKSEADLEEIMDGLQEQAMEDKKMRSYAVIPPLMLDANQKKYYFVNENGALADMEADFKDRQHLNLWTSGEKEIFKEKFLQHPKNFGAIAASLDRKTAQDCVRYYYLSKKTDNYKQLLRKARQRTRSSKNPQKATINQSQCIIDALTTGVTTRLQREQQQKIGVRDRSATTSSTAAASSNQASTAAAASGGGAASGSAGSTSTSGTATPVSTAATTAASSTSTPVVALTNLSATSSGSQEGIPAASADASESGQQTFLNQTTNQVTTTTPAAPQNHVESESGQQNHQQQLPESFPAFAGRNKDETSPSDAPPVVTTDQQQITTNPATDYGAIDSISVPLHQMDATTTTTNKDLSITLERTGKDDSTEIIAVDKDVLQFCFVCKATLCSRSRPLEKSRCKQYGIPESSLVAGARVCNTCQCKSLRSKYSSCPLPTCPNAKDRVKRFRNLPTRLFDLAPELRDAIIAEFQIPPGVQKCCSACLIRIRRKLAPHIQSAVFTDEEVARLKTGLAEFGHNWSKLEEVMGKPVATVRMFYSVNRKKCGLEEAVAEYYKKNPGEMRDIQGEISDVDESDFSTSSCDEREANSDTASAESPPTNAPVGLNASQISAVPPGVVPKPTIDVEAMTVAGQMTMVKKSSSMEEERMSQPEPAKRHSMKSVEECDSSATETADEENELSPANRQSPKVLLYPNQTTITMLPFPGQNGPRDVSSPPQNVRDMVLNVIERSLKTATTGPQMVTPAKVGIIKTPFTMESRADISYMREVKDQQQQQQQSSSHPSDTLATISVLNSQNRGGLQTSQQASAHHPGAQQGAAAQFAATITPVPMAKVISPATVAAEMQKDATMKMYATMRTEPEPQTLDLSVKKTPQTREVPSQAKQTPPTPPQMANNVVTMLRTDAGVTQMSLPQQTGSPNHIYQTHAAFHQQLMTTGGPPSKSPSIFVPVTMGQQGIYHQVPTTRGTSSTVQTTMMKAKMSPKPNMQQPSQPSGASGQGGPKGSITHGTPVSSVTQQQATFLLQANPSASPRFESAPQPSSEKIGSITQGTPVHMPPHHLNEKHRVYEYYKNNRQSPAQPPPPPPQSSPQANFAQSYARSFGMDQQQLSSRQIIVNDYFTSQQMHGQARGARASQQPTPEKDSHSPRNVATINAMYYDKERQRTDYMSRSSPAENSNSSLSRSLKTPPPPQRQGVIQRHNTGGSKPSSPAPNRLHVMPHHYPPPGGERMSAASVKEQRERALTAATLAGHEAFSSLVDVAVQQPLLPVPQDKRPPTFQGGNPASHHDIRFHHQLAFQLHHQQQLQQLQQVGSQHFVDIERSKMLKSSPHHGFQLDSLKLESQRRLAAGGGPPPPTMSASTFEELQFERERRGEEQQQQQHPFVTSRDGRPPSHEQLIERHAHLERELAHSDHERLMERDAMLASASEERALQAAEIEKAAAAAEQQEQQRRAAIAMAAASQQSYDPPKVSARQILDRERERGERSLLPPRSTDGTLTAANLIDAIITHQINQSASEPPPVSVSRALHKSGFFGGRDLHGSNVYENSGGSGGSNAGSSSSSSNQSANVIKIGFDSEPDSRGGGGGGGGGMSGSGGGSGGSVMTKNITIGQLTDSIIQKDYGPNPFHPLRQTQYMQQYPSAEQMIATDQWGRRLGKEPQGNVVTVDRLKKVTVEELKAKEEAAAKEAAKEEEENRMRMTTAPSPNHAAALKSASVTVSESVAEPSGAFYHINDASSDRRQHGGLPSHQTQFALDCYVKNRIVEAMRTEDEKRSDSLDRERELMHLKQQQQYGKMEVVVEKTGGAGDSTGDDPTPPGGVMLKQGQSFGSAAATSVASFSSSAYHYPYSALNVTPAPPTSIATVAITKTTDDQQRPQPPEPKPLLSAQYEELSDEE